MSNMIAKDNKLVFVPDKHEYFYDGKKLSGITKLVSFRLRKPFPTGAMPSRVADAAEFGTNVHEDVEAYLDRGKRAAHPASHFVCTWLDKEFPEEQFERYGELLVSDKRLFATAIDIALINRETRLATIADIKTGNFDREYCSWQLSLGAELLEKLYGIQTEAMYVINTKEGRSYKILPKRKERVMSLLYG